MRSVILASLASASMLLSPAAMATQSYVAVTGGMPVTFEGKFDVYKGINIVGCDVTLVLNGPNDGGDGHTPNPHTDMVNVTVQDLTFDNGDPDLCDIGVVFVSVDSLEYTSFDPSTGSLGQVTFRDLIIATPLTPGGCRGDIVASWNEFTQALAFNGVLPAHTGGNPCFFSGTLKPNKLVDFSADGDTNH